MRNDVQHAATWQDVAPLLQRWQMALWPVGDGWWEVHTGYLEGWTQPCYSKRVPFARLPEALLALAARCEAEEAAALREPPSRQRQCLECGTIWLQLAGTDTGCPQCR